MSAHARPLGGKVLTRQFLLILTVGLLGGLLILYRFFVGLSAVTNLSDGYSWGIWKPLNVVIATGIGSGGYAMALTVYVLNRGKFHPLVRPALLVGALGYTIGGASVMVDLGRWWNILKVPVFVWAWNGNSVLLEVAICFLTYLAVLWTELSPAVLEGLDDHRTLGKHARWVAPKLARAMPFIIALGVLLPTMHQSSLGSLFLLSTFLHPFWHTGLLPLLFLISTLMMGFSSVVGVDALARYLLGRRQDRDMVPLDPDRFSTNQDAMIKLIGWAGNMTISNCFLQAVCK